MSFTVSGHSPDQIRIWKCWFLRRGETEVPGEKNSRSKLNQHMTPSPGIEPGPHWWEASTLTTVLSLLPVMCFLHM